MNRRPLSDEEKAMWEQVTHGDKRVSSNQVEDLSWQKKKIATPSIQERPPQLSVPEHTLPPLASGAYAGIDRATAERFRKGKYPLDGTLDLHGMSREKAHQSLAGFVRSHYERGSRCLLIITGKGFKKEGDPLGGEVRGILRDMLPQWLDEPGLRGMVLAFDQAQQRHGGMGAFYVLLRRRR